MPIRKRKALSESVSSAIAPSTETPSSGDDGILQKLDKFKRASIVAKHPTVCSIHFNKLSCELMNSSNIKKHKPSGRYRSEDYSSRIEFLHRGSPHAHTILWLKNDPADELSENMPLTCFLQATPCHRVGSRMHGKTLIDLPNVIPNHLRFCSFEI